MKSITLAVTVLVVFVFMASAARPQDAPKTSQKKEDLLPVGQKFTGKNVVYNKQEGDRRLFVPDTNYSDKKPSFVLVDSEEKWLLIKPTLKVKHPVLEKVNMKEDIVLVAFGGKREKKYRQMVGDLMYVEKKDGDDKSLSVVMEVKVDDREKKNDVSFGYSSAAIIILSRSSLPEGFEFQKENFSLMFNKEKEKEGNQKGKNKKSEKYNVFGPILKASD